MTLAALLPLLATVALLALLWYQQHTHVSFTRRVFTGLGLGVAFGVALQWLVAPYSHHALPFTQELLEIIGSGYVKLLQMIVIPLIMVSIVSALLKLNGGSSLGKISVATLGVLLFTTMVAAGAGILMANVFGLSAEGLAAGAAEVARGETLVKNLSTVETLSVSKMVLDFLPANPFLDMTGARKTSTIAVVVFSVMVGLAATGIARKKPEIFASFKHFVDVAQAIVMRLVTIVLRLTPHGVFALMAKVVSGSNWDDALNLINFVLASYGAIFLMFGVHLLLVTLAGVNPLLWARKVIPVLTFAFTSRTSAGAIPMNVATQHKLLGIPEGIANFAASFGATIGQNGCAGIYPAMLAVMIAPTVGVDPTDLHHFILPLIAIITVSSFGVAGVGGGATFAALIVLSALDFPVALAGLLISIEPLIDMGRTALNVSGSITAGTVASRLLGQTDMNVFHSEQSINLDEEMA